MIAIMYASYAIEYIMTIIPQQRVVIGHWNDDSI